MGIISNIIDLVQGIGDSRKALKDGNVTFKTTRQSISRKSSNSILQFPVICSNALSADDLMMVSKALEREYAQFVRIAASLDDVIKSGPNAKMDKIRSIHQNIGYRGNGSISFKDGHFHSFSDSMDLRYTTICEEFRVKNIELLKTVNEDLNMSTLNDMTNRNNRNYYTLGEAKSVDKMTDDELARAIKELQYKNSLSKHGMDKDEKMRNVFRWDMEQDRAERDAEKHKWAKQAANRDSEKHAWAKQAAGRDSEKHGWARQAAGRDAEKHDWARQAEMRNAEMHELRKMQMQHSMLTAEYERRQRELDRQNTVIDRTTNFGQQLLSTDIKKVNELVPTMMELDFIYETPNGQLMKTNLIIGVKTVNHLVTSDEMMLNVATAVKEKRHFFKFIQWTSGEIEMVKDWILAKDKIKDDVRRQSSGKESKWWSRMKGRAAEDKLRRFTFHKNDVLPNSTLVLTMDEVEMIQNTYNINILKDDRAKNALFSTFFLLGLVIVDPAAELAYFSFDGNEDFQVQSYRSLEKEASSAADMKSLISLIDKTGR